MSKIDKLDKQILQLISADARIAFLEVARACGVSGAAIHQRIQKLTAMGVLKGSEFVIDPESIGYETCAYIGLNLKDPEKFDEVVEKLKGLGLASSQTLISFHTAISRQLPIDGLVLENDEQIVQM